MTAKTSQTKKLSPSRIEKLLDCSYSYYANYVLKLPDSGNNGSKRGSIIHDLYECLASHPKRHYPKFKKMRDSGDVYSIKCVERFIRIKARQYKLNLNEWVLNKAKNGMIQNKTFINEMILAGLTPQFYGKRGDKILAEQYHELNVDRPEDGIRYELVGYIDKTFIRSLDTGEISEIEVHDYKSSKDKFSKEKLKFNMQGVAYQLFLKSKYPDVKNISMKFLFLQFPNDPWQEVDPVEDDIVKGVEIYLSHLYEKINNFTEEDAVSNFSKYNGKFHFCGGDGFKSYKDKKLGKVETNEPKWKCPHKDPYDYFAIVSEDGSVVRTSLKEKDLIPKEGEQVRRMEYAGCPAWH